MTKGAQPGTERTVTLDVSLLGRDFKVACKEAERAELTDAVALLDRRMREIRESGKIAGAERIAVMAALNLAHDLLRERKLPRGAASAPAPAAASSPSGAVDELSLRHRIAAMNSSLDQALAGQGA
jgi:cell division protein ZapA (FtsZ GTPase activity inhibitor)